MNTLIAVGALGAVLTLAVVFSRLRNASLSATFAGPTDGDARVRLMSKALESSSNEVYVIAPTSMQILYANPAACRNLGYSEEELLTMTVPGCAPEMRSAGELQRLTRQLEEQGEVSRRFDHRRKNGSTYPFEFNGILVEGDGRMYLLVIGNDVSPRIAQEEALRESETRLQLALAGSNDGLFDFDLHDSTLYVSELVSGWLNVAGDELSLAELLNHINESDRGEVGAALDAAIAEGREFNVEFRVGRPVEGQRWLSARGQVQFDENGTPGRLSGFVSDITRRKLAERLLRSTVGRLAAVLDHVGDGIVTLDDDGIICTMNRAALRMCGFAKDGFAGMSLNQLLSIEDEIGGREEIIWLAIADGHLRDCVATRQDGSRFAAEISATQLDLLSDECYTVVIRDVSERRRHEIELREAMEEAQAATRAKGEFLATMSHEIRTPMNGVLGMTQLLLDMDLTAEQHETAHVIYSSGESLLTLINDILDYSKIEAGKLQLESLAFDLRAAIKEVLDLLAGSARKKRLDLYIDYADDLDFAFLGDVGRLRQILMNLVGNAIKFTDSGYVLVKVSQPNRTSELARVRIAVHDTGPGVPSGLETRLFDSFTQADTSTTRKFGGTGLGLAICKQLVELMGGDIGVARSSLPYADAPGRAGSGAEFWFELEMRRANDVTPDATSDSGLLESKRVLVVGENAVGVRIIADMARSLQIQTDCTVTGDPAAALQWLDGSGRTVDAVVLDSNLEDVDGTTLAAKIREDERFDAVKTVLLTSSNRIPLAGVDAHAMKPIMRRGFAEALMSALFGHTRQSAPLPRDESFEKRRLHVLVAEDNPVNQKVAVKMLEKLGCAVDVAANGHEAIRMWARLSYSLIFMDCQMPDLDGLSATRLIREKEQQSDRTHTPIVAMTANAMTQDQADCRAAGMDDYASKPVRLSELRAMLEKWVPVEGGAGADLVSPRH